MAMLIIRFNQRMDLHSLRCFCQLAETLNFRQAAQRLNMSQPALSLRLKRLEDELGLRLFERSRAGVAISDAGRQFLPHAERLLRQAEVTRETAAQIAAGWAGRLRLGYTPVSFFSYVPELIRRYAVDHPGVEITLAELLSGAVEASLSAHEIDAGILHPPVANADLAVHALRGERLVVALAADNPLARRRTLTLGDLAAEDFILVARGVGPAIYDQIIGLCLDAGFTPRIRQEVMTSVAILGLVAAGYGVGLVIEPMRRMSRPGLRFKQLQGPAPYLPFAVATRASGAAAAVRAFVAHATTYSPRLDPAG